METESTAAAHPTSELISAARALIDRLDELGIDGMGIGFSAELEELRGFVANHVAHKPTNQQQPENQYFAK